jgi:hypothetical protein
MTVFSGVFNGAADEEPMRYPKNRIALQEFVGWR